MPVSTRSFEIGDWYQGSSRLKTITPQPITAIRSFPPRPRRSRSSLRGSELRPSVERLAATVACFQVVPVADFVLAELPAEVDLEAVKDRREVHQAAVDVPKNDPRLLDRLQQSPDLQEGDPDLLSLLAAAVTGSGLRESLVGFGVCEVVLRLAQPVEHGGQLRKEGVRLLPREVAFVD